MYRRQGRRPKGPHRPCVESASRTDLGTSSVARAGLPEKRRFGCNVVGHNTSDGPPGGPRARHRPHDERPQLPTAPPPRTERTVRVGLPRKRRNGAHPDGERPGELDEMQRPRETVDPDLGLAQADSFTAGTGSPARIKRRQSDNRSRRDRNASPAGRRASSGRPNRPRAPPAPRPTLTRCRR